MAQRLKNCAVHAEDLRAVASTHTGQLTITYNSVSWDLTSSSGLPGCLQSQAHPHTQMHIYAHH